jgi:hypothetical protein
MTIEAEHDGLRFVIEEDNPDVGVYLYIYDARRCIRDILQNDIATCKQVALEEYGVSLQQWRVGKRVGKGDSESAGQNRQGVADERAVRESKSSG